MSLPTHPLPPEELVQAYFDGELSVEDAAGLQEWLAAAPENRAGFAEQLEVHALLWEERLAAQPIPGPRPVSARKPAGGRGVARMLRLPWLAAAAVLLLAAGVGAWLLGRPSASPTPSSRSLGRTLTGGLVAVRRGQDAQLPAGSEVFAGDALSAPQGGGLELADGSTVKLDRGTGLTISPPMTGERVRLRLDSGRVFVRAAHVPGSFVVAASAEVRVLGTVFGVEEAGGRTAVSVQDGRVAVSSAGKAIELVRGLSGAAAAGAAPELTGADADEALKWARDWTRFEDRPLGEVLDWLAANSSYRFQMDEALRGRHRVTVAIAGEPPREVIEALMLSCGLDYRFDGHDVTVK